MVRLESHGLDISVHLNLEFQFLNGAIRIRFRGKTGMSPAMFQFLNGAIRIWSLYGNEDVGIMFQFLNGAIRIYVPSDVRK